MTIKSLCVTKQPTYNITIQVSLTFMSFSQNLFYYGEKSVEGIVAQSILVIIKISNII